MRVLSLLVLACGCAQVQQAPAPPDGAPPDLAAGPDDAGDDLAAADRPRDLAPPPDLAGCLAQVKVNEVSTGGVSSATDEFVELFNPCAMAVDLTGSMLTYRAATNATATDSSVIAKLTGSIAPNGYYLVANTSYSGAATPDIKPFDATPGLAATGGAVGLRDPLGTLVDSVGWGTANNPFVEAATASAPAAGKSTARQPNGVDTNNNRNDLIESARTPRAVN